MNGMYQYKYTPPCKIDAYSLGFPPRLVLRQGLLYGYSIWEVIPGSTGQKRLKVNDEVIAGGTQESVPWCFLSTSGRVWGEGMHEGVNSCYLSHARDFALFHQPKLCLCQLLTYCSWMSRASFCFYNKRIYTRVPSVLTRTLSLIFSSCYLLCYLSILWQKSGIFWVWVFSIKWRFQLSVSQDKEARNSRLHFNKFHTCILVSIRLSVTKCQPP